MLPHSMIRNQRSKGFNVQKTIQLAFFLVVALWLLYQVKHSFDKKANNDYQKKFGAGDGMILMGRKAKTRSQNSMDMDQNGGDVGELIEREDIEEEDSDDATKRRLRRSEDEEASQTNQDSEEDNMMNNVERQAETENGNDVAKHKSMNNVEKQAETNNVDDVAKYKGKQKAKEKELSQLPSQMNGVNSSDRVKEGTGENVGEFDDSAIPAVDAETESSQYAIERGAGENDTKSDAQNITSPTEEKDTTSMNNAEPAKDGDAKAQDSAASIDTKNEEEISDSLKPNVENNRVMPTNFEASIKDSVDIQVDNGTEVETTSNTSPKVVKGGKKLDKKSSRLKKVRGSNASQQDRPQKEEF